MIALILPAALVTVVGLGFLFWQAADAKLKEAQKHYDASLCGIEAEYEKTIDRLGSDLAAERDRREQAEADLHWSRLTVVLQAVDKHGDDDLRREVLGNVTPPRGAR